MRVATRAWIHGAYQNWYADAGDAHRIFHTHSLYKLAVPVMHLQKELAVHTATHLLYTEKICTHLINVSNIFLKKM